MKMPQLNLPKVALKTKSVEGTIQVFDVIRKKYFALESGACPINQLNHGNPG